MKGKVQGEKITCGLCEPVRGLSGPLLGYLHRNCFFFQNLKMYHEYLGFLNLLRKFRMDVSLLEKTRNIFVEVLSKPILGMFFLGHLAIEKNII